MIEQLVARVFSTRNAVHLAHWKTKSYAQHVALGDFYDGLIDRIDAIVEMYQGAFGLIENVDVQSISNADIMEHIGKEANWLEEHRSEIAGDVWAIENQIDELAGLYLSTFYKLKNLS
jgi:hypothetical protein